MKHSLRGFSRKGLIEALVKKIAESTGLEFFHACKLGVFFFVRRAELQADVRRHEELWACEWEMVAVEKAFISFSLVLHRQL